MGWFEASLLREEVCDCLLSGGETACDAEQDHVTLGMQRVGGFTDIRSNSQTVFRYCRLAISLPNTLTPPKEKSY